MRQTESMLNRRESRRLGRGLIISVLMVCLAGCNQIFPKRTPGEKLYRKHCAECHGADGGGQTVSSMGNPDANLLDDSWRHPSDASGMQGVIMQGLVWEHPSFDKLSRQEVQQIVDHVLSLRGERRD